MNNVVEINGEKAVIAFDPEIQMLRGEFVGPCARSAEGLACRHSGDSDRRTE